MITKRRKSRLLPSIHIEFVRQFVAGVPALTASNLVGVHDNTATLYDHKLRDIICENLALDAPFLSGSREVDESYFGGHRKGKRGRGAAGKAAVFGVFKRAGKAHTFMIDNGKRLTLLPIIRHNIKPDSIVYTDCFKAYDALDVSEFYHQRINHSKEFAGRENHINGIENFWSHAKRHLRKYNGIPQKTSIFS